MEDQELKTTIRKILELRHKLLIGEIDGHELREKSLKILDEKGVLHDSEITSKILNQVTAHLRLESHLTNRMAIR